MSILRLWKARAVRFVFDRFILPRIGYDVDGLGETCDEERILPTATGPVRALIHRPGRDSGPLPLFVNIHGGGFVFGLPEHDAVFCRRIAARVGCVVANLDYARAPEHPFPVAPDQCYAAVAWLAEHAAELGIDASRIAVGGHSAGGNLTAYVVAQAKARGGPDIRFQVLDYPFTDARTDPAAKRVRTDKPLLKPGLMNLFNACYVPPELAGDPRVSPLFAPLDELRGQPPALVITAEYDALRDEGDAYAARLREAGVPVRHEVFPGVDHVFTHVGPKAQADAAWALMEDCLRQAFRPN
ncbi:MAG: alpha/beta hydrolase [Rhodocyclales bacterium]|nr:alpha/beta hydrolase [Rhodocyclales bacterium]